MVKHLAVSAALAAGCAPVVQPQPVYVTAQANAAAAVGASDDSSPGAELVTPPIADGVRPMAPSARAVIVLVDKHVDRPTEVLGVFDFHTAETSQDKGFDELRERAAAMGADAVIGAEFEHGDDGGPSHLSGMAVRFLDH